MFSKFLTTVAVAAVLASSLLVSADTMRDQQILATDEAVAAINSIPGLTWFAAKDNGIRVNGATVADIKHLCGVDTSKPKFPLERITYAGSFKKSVDAPASFSAATKWSQCRTILSIRDQSACGSCWATAAAEMISDRYCTYGVHDYLPISNADIMECCWYCGRGCSGGQPTAAAKFFCDSGVVSEACQPYPFPKCEHHEKPAHPKYPPCPSKMYPTPACPGDRCPGNATGNATIYKGSKAWTLAGEEDYMAELMKNGPFEVAFSVYADFPLYKGGVYRRTSNEYLGGHAVKIIGWGVENGTKFWLIANSWNGQWGTWCEVGNSDHNNFMAKGVARTRGCFKILRGQNECGIEESGSAVAP